METAPKILPDLEALQAEAAAFGATLSPRVADTGQDAVEATPAATLVTLSGELGAGKTSFTQGLARALGVEETVTSPTFVLEKIYALPEATGRGFKRLAHIDAYRLERGTALVPLGFHELMQDRHTLILLEWPERVADALPAEAIRLQLSVNEDNTRSISYA